MTIPKDEYKKEHKTPFITKALLDKYHTPKEVKAFGIWFTGQTGLITSEGEYGIYTWDYERWLEEGKLKHQLPGTWD